ncbi:hypothetical protein [Legionella sp. PC1000]|uniref:hypothetical protein n=1 Tax=Legionella sp. PC1000 TaxID=2746060 RepID=UPI0015FDA705|nr:hypothetical protein [Legionella sp. PC1000]
MRGKFGTSFKRIQQRSVQQQAWLFQPGLMIVSTPVCKTTRLTQKDYCDYAQGMRKLGFALSQIFPCIVNS